MTRRRFGSIQSSVLLLLPSIYHAFLLTIPSSRHQSPLSSTSLSGIRGFRGWFESQFPGAITTLANTKSNKHSENFDHVLVDMNELLHICVRKSRSEGHALVLLLKELDAIVALTTPQMSLVLAMDGPPPAAKLAIQRSRRFSLLRKAEWRRKHMQKVKYLDEKQMARKKRRAKVETKTLCITPGTEFMERAHQAVMYWAWQRLDSTASVLAKNNVQIILSPSTVHGEGEVKLLSWIYDHQRRQNQESIAIYGGDSDLVLEALIVPTTITHNVFVLLPDGDRKIFAVSLWETTRTLMSKLPDNNIVHLRTDLVLLLILNGNDYLPKLRGSSGFHKLFQTYITMQRVSRGNLVDPDTLELNLPFCIAFFTMLAESVPESSYEFMQQQSTLRTNLNKTYLSQLNNYVIGGYIPGPVEFHVIRAASENGPDGFDDNATTDSFEIEGVGRDEDVFKNGKFSDEDASIVVQLRLGSPESDDFYVYEIWKPDATELKHAKQELASMALDELSDFDDDTAGDAELFDAKDHDYDWEVLHAEGKVEDYLYGLLWNLQTYQDGICADYAFNYGRKLSPTASDIVSYLQGAFDAEEAVGVATLRRRPFSPAMTAGVACLAALPAAVKHLVPKPYRLIPDKTVESIYADCINETDNAFDSNQFQRLCDDEVARLSGVLDNNGSATRCLVPSRSCWTVLSKANKPLVHAFDPPVPFSEKLSDLRANNRILIAYLPQLEHPRQRLSWSLSTNRQKKQRIVHSELVPFMDKLESLESVRYKKAFSNVSKSNAELTALDTEDIRSKMIKGYKEYADVSDPSACKAILFVPPHLERLQLSDGTTAVACLRQLVDIGLVNQVKWHMPADSGGEPGNDPSLYESIGLTVFAAKRNLTLSCDRKVSSVSRKTTKQYLAAVALEQLTDESRWQELTFRELRDRIL